MDQHTRDLIQFKELNAEEPGQISAVLYIDENLPPFSGHFPGKPLLPAVSIIDISLLLISHFYPHICFNKIQIEKSKFTAMVRPKQSVRIQAQSGDNKNWMVVWRSEQDQSQLAQVRIVI